MTLEQLRIFVAVAICVFFASFFQPAYTDDGSNEAAEPIAIFLTGWMGIFCGSLACFSWLANPLFFIALILFPGNGTVAALIWSPLGAPLKQSISRYLNDKGEITVF